MKKPVDPFGIEILQTNICCAGGRRRIVEEPEPDGDGDDGGA